MFTLPIITDKYKSIHNKDFLLFPMILAFGFAIDGLYGMGHFLSFGIAVIVSIQFVISMEKIQQFKIKVLLTTFLVIIFAWHGIVKFSIWQGLDKFEKKEFSSAISHLERGIAMYPKSIGRFHLILGEMYLENREIENARKHALKAKSINPEFEATKVLLQRINILDKN